LLSSGARAARQSPSPTRHIHARVARTASVALRLALFTLAAWALSHELSGVQLGELLRQFGDYGWRHALLALAGTAASFAVLGLIESLAVTHTGTVRIPRRTVMATAFVANAFSQSIGLALLTGSAVRLRAYARRGVDAAAVARISTFVTVTITLGLLACGAVALLASREPLRIAQTALPVRVVGASLALVVIAYLVWGSVSTPDQVSPRWLLLRRPGARVVLTQLALSSLDWVVTGTVLFAVLPSAAGLHHGAMLRTYLVAQTVGMASHVPGGAGVFEAVVLTLAATGVPSQRAALIAALVMFRVVYYLVPLLSALVVGGLAELLPRGRRPARATLEREVAHVH
jgi:uncharacterized membrane protein YbhN (UPF0104 family)